MLLNEINDLYEIYNKIQEVKDNNLTWKINNEIFIALVENNYSVIFIVKNKINRKTFLGKYIKLKSMDQVKIKVDDLEFIKPGIVIECTTNEKEIKEAFLIFMTILINNFEFVKFNAYEEIFKFWQLFERDRNRNEKLIQGFLGELLIIDLFYKKFDLDISNFYHQNNYNKWDFEFNNKLVMEVKTTANEDRKHTFSYSQIQNNLRVIICSVKLLIHETGMTVYELAENLTTKINNFNFTVQVKSFLFSNRISKDEPGITFNYENALDSVYFYLNSELPKLNGEIPDEIFNIKYDLSLNNIKNENIQDILNNIRQNV